MLMMLVPIGCEDARQTRYEAQVRTSEQIMSDVQHWANRYELESENYEPLLMRFVELRDAKGEICDGRLSARLPEYDRLHEDYEEIKARAAPAHQNYDRLVIKRESLHANGKLDEAISLAEEMIPLAEKLRDQYWQLQIDAGNLIWHLDIMNGWMTELVVPIGCEDARQTRYEAQVRTSEQIMSDVQHWANRYELESGNYEPLLMRFVELRDAKGEDL